MQSQARTDLPNVDFPQLVTRCKLKRDINVPVFANEAVGRLYTNLDFVCVRVISTLPDGVVVQLPRTKVLPNVGLVCADV